MIDFLSGLGLDGAASLVKALCAAVFVLAFLGGVGWSIGVEFVSTVLSLVEHVGAAWGKRSAHRRDRE